MDELILKIDVKCENALEVDGKMQKIVMVPFTGTAESKYFAGKVTGTGVDTQKYPKDKQGNFLQDKSSLSARYMLEGTDFEGNRCHIFIENNVNSQGWIPTIVTDSKALCEWETQTLRSTVTPNEHGVTVEIFRS